MKYMLLIYGNEQHWDEQSRQQCYDESLRLVEELRQAGQYIASSPLQPVATATSVRVRQGKQLITDGPFAETHEQLGGYFLIEAEAMEDALAIAARIPAARVGTVEVRPVVELAGLETARATGEARCG